MASSGTVQSWVNTNSTGTGAYYSFEWTSTQKSAAVTTVSWSLYGRGRSSSPTWLSNYCLVNCTVNGSTTQLYEHKWSSEVGDGTGTSFKDNLRTSGSFDVKHSSDGSGSFVIDMTVAIYTTDQHSTSETVTLDKNYGNVVITYNANNGSGAPSALTTQGGKSTTLSTVQPTRTGYTFLGWSTSSTATSATYTAGGSITPTDNMTLYAVWRGNTYSIKYNANGGSGSMSNSTHTYGTSSKLTANAFSRGGYSFKNWNTASNGTGTSYSNQASISTGTTSGTLNLYAQWTALPYIITYKLNGGTLNNSTSDQTQSYTTSDALTLYGAPTRAGYTFSGWKVTTAAGNWTSGSIYNANQGWASGDSYGSVTLTAQWAAIKYTITYNADGGSMSSTTQTYYITTALTLYGAPTKTGYAFTGWKVTSADGNWSNGYIYNAGQSWTSGASYGSVTLTAQWTAWTYTITYNANNSAATIKTATSSHSYADGSTLTPAPFSIAGYSLIGWSTTTTGSVAYQNGTTAPYQLVTSNGQNVDLYAQWTQDTPWRLCQVKLCSGSKWHTC